MKKNIFIYLIICILNIIKINGNKRKNITMPVPSFSAENISNLPVLWKNLARITYDANRKKKVLKILQKNAGIKKCIYIYICINLPYAYAYIHVYEKMYE
jgi:hypothetical protein